MPTGAGMCFGLWDMGGFVFIPDAGAWDRDHALFAALDAGLSLGAWPAGSAPKDPGAHAVQQLVARARGQQLGAAVLLGAQRLGWTLAPDAEVAQATRRALAQALVHQTTRNRVTQALDHAGIAHVFFKGALTDPLFHGGKGLRGSLDVDVLVAPGQWAAAQGALRSIGFTAETSASHPATARASKEMTFLDGAAVVDLHRRVMNSPPFHDDPDGLVARRVAYSTGAGPIWGPSVEDLLVSLAGNLANDRFLPRIKLALDATALLQRGVDLAVAAHRAQDAGCAGALWALGRLLAVHRLWAGPDLAPRPVAPLATWLELLAGIHGEPPRPASHLVREVLEAWPWSGRWDYPVVASVRWAGLRAADRAWRLVFRP